MKKSIQSSLEQFLDDYQGMSIMPYIGDKLCLCGTFSFIANPPEGEKIEDHYRLEILVPENFPRSVPTVKELDKRIPKNGDYHVNSDTTFCLGSPLRLLEKISEFPTLSGFASECLVPYLYAVSYKMRNGGDFVFGELRHENPGIIDDYCDLLGLSNQSQVNQAIQLLGMRKRRANKKPCPCGCGKRLGACRFHRKLNKFRKMASISWFRENANRLEPILKE